MADGSIEFSTKLDNTQLEKDIKSCERRIDGLKLKLSDKTVERNFLKDKMDEAVESLDAAKARLGELGAEYERLLAVADSASPAEYPQAAAAAHAAYESYMAASAEVDAQRKKVEGIRLNWEKASDSVELMERQLEGVEKEHAFLTARTVQLDEGYQGASRTLRERVADAGRDSAKAVAAAHTRAAGTLRNAYTTASKAAFGMMKQLLPFVTVGAGISMLLGSIKKMVLANREVEAGVNGLKAACNGFAAGLANIAAPAILGFVRVATTMLMTLARLVDSIFKTDFAGAIAAQVAAANQAVTGSSGDSAKATSKQAKAAEKLAKAQKKANRQLMSFDELNVLNAKDSTAAAAATPSAGGSAAGASLLDGIDAALAEIMLIAGAALLAIGIILAFSGINIPLGITLMAIGALMIYTAYSEQWGKLPREVQNALTAIIAVIGGALIAVGVLLCVAGQPALGIAFIIAGAAMFAVAATINPEYTGQLVSQAFQHILGMVGGMLLAIGVVLAATGNIPLGIGFIIAGASLLVMEAVVSWESLPAQVQGVLMAVMSIAAAALLALGVMLCAVGHPVLGIAAIIAGIGVFVMAAVLDDDEAPNRVRTFLSGMLPIIGKAMAVVGVLLCVVGNLPLGIAAIVFGIGVWVTGAALAEGVPASKISAFLAEMLPAIGQALIVIGVMLCVFGQLPFGIAAVVAGVAVFGVSSLMLDESLTEDKIRWFFDSVLPIIEGGMVALGVLLCATGVMVPLGLGLIVAGIGALGVSAVAEVDWGFLLEKVRGIWDAIGGWFQSEVEPFFTEEFWREKFAGIANGLIGALNWALQGAGSFINDLSDGLAGILNFWGVDGYQFSISMPEIPYLATGAVIPPNRRFMAVLGDQTNGTNLEAPEGLIRQIVREESGGAGAEMLAAVYALLDAVREGKNIYMDETLVGRTVQSQLATMGRMSGA